MINEPYFPDLGVFVSMLIRDIPAAQSVTVVDHFYAVCLRNLIDKTVGPESRVLGSFYMQRSSRDSLVFTCLPFMIARFGAREFTIKCPLII